MKKDKINNLGSYPSKGQREEGKTMLSPAQRKKLDVISTILTGYTHKYDNVHLSYSPKGIISALNDQVKLKKGNGDINEIEIKEVLLLIEELGEEIIK